MLIRRSADQRHFRLRQVKVLRKYRPAGQQHSQRHCRRDNDTEPDALVVPAGLTGKRDRSDVIVVFEVLSPSTKDRDLNWKRAAYTSLASLTHDVVIAEDAVEVTVFARENGFERRTFDSRDDIIAFNALGVSLSVADIYYRTGL